VPTPCFWVEATGDVDMALRRFRLSSEGDACPVGYGYHNAEVPIGRAPDRRTPDGYSEAPPVEEYAGDVRWPTRCACGYAFTDEDQWQVWTESIYRRLDTGQEWAQRSMPPGAMLDGFWLPQKGPDGIALVVVLPPAADDTRGHWWHVDGPSRNNGVAGPGWTRTGDPRARPPTVTATPSILTDSYHGFLTSGALTDPL
jgi:hypothetical protein